MSNASYGEWVRVEIFGHRVHYGRAYESEFAGAKMLTIEVPTAIPGQFLLLRYGGAAVFSLAPCTEAHARAMAMRYVSQDDLRAAGMLPTQQALPGLPDDPEPPPPQTGCEETPDQDLPF